MKFIVFYISFFMTFGLVAQDSLWVSILGSAGHVEYAKDYSLELRFEENPNRCDPNIGFVSLEDQIKDFKESLISVGGDPSKLIMLDDLLYSEYRTQKCTYEDSDFERMFAVIEKCQNLNIIIESSLYLFEPHSFQGEDQKAIKALHNAKAKAAIFKREFGYEQIDIVSIDDDSSSSVINDLFIDRSEEERERMMEFINMLNENDSGNTMHSRLSPREKKSSTYTLQITFCLSNN